MKEIGYLVFYFGLIGLGAALLLLGAYWATAAGKRPRVEKPSDKDVASTEERLCSRFFARCRTGWW